MLTALLTPQRAEGEACDNATTSISALSSLAGRPLLLGDSCGLNLPKCCTVDILTLLVSTIVSSGNRCRFPRLNRDTELALEASKLVSTGQSQNKLRTRLVRQPLRCALIKYCHHFFC